MESMWLHQSKLLTISAIIVLAGCAAQPKPASIPVPIIIPPAPFKVCPEEPKEEDQPCVKFGPTNTPSIRGLLNIINERYAVK